MSRRPRARWLSDAGRHALAAAVLLALFLAAAIHPTQGGEGDSIPPLAAERNP